MYYFEDEVGETLYANLEAPSQRTPNCTFAFAERQAGQRQRRGQEKAGVRQRNALLGSLPEQTPFRVQEGQ